MVRFGAVDFQESGNPGRDSFFWRHSFDNFGWLFAHSEQPWGFAAIFRTRESRKPEDDRQVSVILRRQIPIRHDTPSQSWLGGLPMMPRLVKWPRSAEGSPLHFLAQISCADLPADLWNGYGPRHGWMLLFIDTLEQDESCRDRVQVLHTRKLGSERESPEDMPSVRHTMSDYIDYTGPNIRPGVPKLWRKWPVDLVVQRYDRKGTLEDDYGPPHVPAEELYAAPVSETPGRR